jgi:hypothetical protein
MAVPGGQARRLSHNSERSQRIHSKGRKNVILARVIADCCTAGRPFIAAPAAPVMKLKVRQ